MAASVELAAVPVVPAAGAGGEGPPSPPSPQLAAVARTASPLASREWWAAVQLPADAEATLIDHCARRAHDFTPRVSVSPPDAVLLELRSCLRLFGGVESLQQALRTSFPPPQQLAFAPTPLAALVFARCGVEVCLTDDEQLVGQLSPLPLAAMRWPEDTVKRLGAVGVRTLGGALRLPRAGFARRFGPATLALLDRLVGRQGDPRQAHVLSERYRRRCDPEVELIHVGGVMTVLTPLFDELERFLRTRQRGITTLVLQLVHRHHAPTRCVLKLAAPAQQAQQFLRLLELQLGRTGLPAPVRRCELRSGPLVEAPQDSGSLWRPGEHGGGAATLQMPSFLEQLRARLGEDAVTGLAFAAEHRPDRVNVPAAPVTVATRSRRGAPPVAPVPPWPAGRRPLWLLPEPAPLAEHDAWPCRDGQRLRLLGGPERLETGWWDGGDVTRDYYQAEDVAGSRLWIFRERRAPQRWFLHGFFG